MEQTAQQENLYDAKIMPKDLLTIVVSCTSPELAVPFNLTVASSASVATGNTQLTTQSVLQPYLVDNEGKINFPVLGELNVGGLTKKEAEQLIVDKLKPVSYTHLRAHETRHDLVCRLLLEKKKKKKQNKNT